MVSNFARAGGRLAAGCLALALAILAGCSDSSSPYVEVDGGGFVFNYRIAEVFYGVSLRPLRRLAAETVLEAAFDDPAGGPPLVVRDRIDGAKLAYSLRSPPVRGVEKDKPYRVVVRVLEPGSGRELQRLEQTFKSDLDQSVMPEQALTIGPGYTPNPALKQQ